jgi:3'-5' exoribonuclease
MDLLSIRDLKRVAGPVSQSVVFRAQLEKCLQKTTKTGNPFYELTFSDSEESLVLRVWNNSPMFDLCGQLRNGHFVEVSGEFGLGNDGRSIDGKTWKARVLNELETAEVLAGSESLRAKQEEDYSFIETTVAVIVDPRLAGLCGGFLKHYGERFKRTGAARDYHHARRGGLVEHVAQMMRSALRISEAYPILNRDLLVAGVLFHDVGKLWENVYEEKGFTMPYTEISELIGHIPLGMEIVNKLWRELLDEDGLRKEWEDLEPASERVRLHLLHLIASHHGELAFGSPVVPKTPEAQALHYIDNLDAKMEMYDRGYGVTPELGKNVYERVRPLPGRLVAPLQVFEKGSDASLKDGEFMSDSKNVIENPDS